MSFLSKKSFIIIGLFFYIIPLSAGCETDTNIFPVQYPDGDSGNYYSFILPDNVFYPIHTLPGSINMIGNPANGSSILQLEFLGVTRIPRDRQALLKKVKFWSWMTLGSVGLNCGIIVLTILTAPEIGALSMITHAWFGVSNTLLGNAYYNLNRSLYTYGPEGKNAYFGIGSAYGAAVFAVIGIGIGATLFTEGESKTPGAIGTVVAAGLSNLLGLSAFVYYLFYDKSL